jgi:hypothetical protein
LKRKQKRAERLQKPGVPSDARLVNFDIHREIRYITQRAQAADARIVNLGSFVLFSTGTRDAWLLDREDGFAACLCRDGTAQPLPIVDSTANFAIGWTARFAIQGNAFIVQEQSGRVVEILGYPVAEISAACRM